MITQRDLLWKLVLRHLLPEFVKFIFRKKYDEVDWQKEPLSLDYTFIWYYLSFKPM